MGGYSVTLRSTPRKEVMFVRANAHVAGLGCDWNSLYVECGTKIWTKDSGVQLLIGALFSSGVTVSSLVK